MKKDFLKQEKETVKCPSCGDKYERMQLDREQIVCPRCLNEPLCMWAESESK